MWRNSREDGGKSTGLKSKKKFWKSQKSKIRITYRRQNAEDVRSTSKMSHFNFMCVSCTHEYKSASISNDSKFDGIRDDTRQRAGLVSLEVFRSLKLCKG